jgi:hypothetical protein
MPSLGTTLLAHSRPEESRRSREWHRRESRVIDTPGRRRGGGRRATLRDSVGTRGLEEETIITRAIQQLSREATKKRLLELLRESHEDSIRRNRPISASSYYESNARGNVSLEGA